MVYIFLAEGFEEIEALTQIDLLRRAGIEVTSVGIDSKSITGAHGIEVVCDEVIDDLSCSDAEMIILPGGMPGVNNLFACEKLLDIITESEKNGVYIAAICAAPLILGRLGFSKELEMICYPGFEDELKGATISKKTSVIDGKIITAKAAGTAFDFAEKLITVLKGCENADKVMRSIYYEK